MNPERPLRKLEGVLVPSQLKSNKTEDDLAFEWLLCLASTLKVSQRLQLTETCESLRSPGFPLRKDRNVLEKVYKRVSILRGKNSNRNPF
jgi:hypothetical protein